MPGYVTLGTDVETGQPIWIGETERNGGLYLLGRSRTGKSNSFISIALQDIARGIGLLFIDPHADAIQAILDRMPGNRINDVMLLDPTDNDYSFSINPLYCANPHNLQERQLTFSQTWDVFAKVFAAEDERLGLLLSKYLGNCLYPLIEHQGYTLYDLWYFLHDASFRESVLSIVTYHPEVVEFWHNDYDNMLPRQKKEEPQALLNRIDSLRRNPYIKHVISQTRSSFDFVEVMEQRKIVLLRLPPWQDTESRTFIGTLVISQLLKAIFLRAEVSEHLRTPFAIFCDEFQLFSTPDFAKVFSQTGKYRLMPAVGHQTRVGQFKPNDPNHGATLAAALKMLFRTSVPDSQEIAPELAKDSPTETKRERLLVISQNPVEDILRGHANPTIQGFVREYLRSLSHRLEDTEAAKEGARIVRQFHVDMAGRMRARVQQIKDDLSTSHSWRYYAVKSAESSVVDIYKKVFEQDSKLLGLFHSTQALRQFMRNLDSFLTAIMEGRIAKGQEAYARFLRELLSVFFPISPPLALFIALEYGDSNMSREIPFELARRHGLYRSEVVALLIQAEERTNRERRAFAERYVKEKWESYCLFDRRWDPIKLEQELNTPKKLTVDVYFGERVEESRLWCPPDLYTQFVWMECFPEVKRLVAPYYTAQFDPLCKACALDTDINRLIRRIEQCLAVGSNPYMSKEAKAWRGDNGANYIYPSGGDGCGNYKQPVHRYYVLLHPKIVAKLMVFLREYKEGAFVTLALLHAASRGGWSPVVINSLYIPQKDQQKKRYCNTSMLNFPSIAGKDPLEVLHLIDTLTTHMHDLQQDYDTFSNKFFAYFERRYYPDNILERLFPPKKSKQSMEKDIRNNWPFSLSVRKSKFSFHSTREDIRWLKQTLTERWNWFVKQHAVAASHWVQADELTRGYILARACDLVYFGTDVANQTFPHSRFPGSPELVAALVGMLEEKEKNEHIAKFNEIKEKGLARDAYNRQSISAACTKELAKISCSPPEMLAARVPSGIDRQTLKTACLRELSGSSVLTVLNECGRFCDHLARPENHVQVPSTQYIETQVNTYSTQEMINQAAKELTRLPRGAAYATLLQEVNDTQIVRIVKIQTARIDEAKTLTGVGEIVKKNAITAGILRKRSDIDNEIIMRQARRGLGMDNDPSSPTDTAGDNPPALNSGRPTRKSLPPPTHYIPPQTPEQQVYSDNGGQPVSTSAKKASPKVRQNKQTPLNNKTGVDSMANSRSANISPAPVPAPLPPQAPSYDFESDRELNMGEGYRVRPFYLCMDVSGSMGMTIADGRTVMDDVNDELADLLTSLRKQPEVCDVTRLSIVSFASDAKVDLPLVNLQDVAAMPVLKASGGTSFTHPFRLLREVIEKDYHNRKSNKWNRPLVIFVTDGYPDRGTEAAWQAARDALLDPEWELHPILAVFGFGEAHRDIITTLASGQKYSGLACISEDGQTSSVEVGRIMKATAGSMIQSKESNQFLEVPDKFVRLETPGPDKLR